jgi:hypothetical protein
MSIMKRLAAAVLSLPLAVAVAQDVRDAATPFAWTPPDESTPFFVSSRDFAAEERAIQAATAPASQYPIAPKPGDSALAQMRNFFTGMFASVNLRGSADTREEAVLALDSDAPSLSDTREVGLTYTVRNTSRRMTRLEFPSGQHAEFLARNAAGTVIERWSDDRTFGTGESIVILNPNERIEYREKISTREMKPGSAYEVEAKLNTSPDFRLTAPLVPR